MGKMKNGNKVGGAGQAQPPARGTAGKPTKGGPSSGGKCCGHGKQVKP